MKGSLSRVKSKDGWRTNLPHLCLEIKISDDLKSNMKATGGDDDAKVRKPMNMIKATKGN